MKMRSAVLLPLFSAAIFLGAFALFAIQPMFTRMALPLLGGSPSVWNTALVFFQAVLLLGYVYAHLVSRFLGLRAQLAAHGLLLVLAFAFLPVSAASGWIAPGEVPPIPWLLALLSVSIGLPYFAVSATAPLLQRWFAWSRHEHAADPYFLYGASNLGGLLALLGYPTVIEPLLGLRAQGLAWTGAYALLVCLILLCGLIVWREFPEARASGAARGAPAADVPDGGIGWGSRLHWMALAFVPSSLLLGVTLHISTDVASFPFMWVVPLALYLLTFVLVFARRPLLRHAWMVEAQALLFVPLALYFALADLAILGLHLLALFFTGMVCHGELARRRPATSRLTEFYLWMSLGGVLGGMFSVLVAPLIFDSILEYPLAVVLACLLRPTLRAAGARGRWLDVALPAALALVYFAPEMDIGFRPDTWGRHGPLLFFVGIAVILYTFRLRPLRFALGMALIVLGADAGPEDMTTIYQERSFFGVHRVRSFAEGKGHILYHGTTVHGAQVILGPSRREPLAYFTPGGPLGQVLAALSKHDRGPRRIGYVGLGIGSIACQRRPEQEVVYFEIDPAVVKIARDTRLFQYLEDCGEGVTVKLGDGRMRLAQEPDGGFDLIILDAFSSDAIPVHLLTREAMALYLEKLTDDGLLLFHVSSRFTRLAPVVGNLAADARLEARIQIYDPQGDPASSAWERRMALRSRWVLVGRGDRAEALLEGDGRWRPLPPDPSLRLWTDDYADVLGVLNWRRLLR